MQNKELLSIVADNQNLFDALKKVILDEFEVTSPQADLGISDEILGQIFRARLVGISKVESAFRKILNHKSIPEQKDSINMAR